MHFGEEHEKTADSYFSLGVTQYQMHDYKAALESHQRALAIRINLFGEEHESTADSYRELGPTHHEMHDYKAAHQSHQRALATVGFHMTSLKFKLQNYRSYWNFTFMMY